MNIEKVVKHFGGLQKTGDELGISRQCVFHWVKTKNIPLIQQCHIEYVTKGKFTADTSDLPFELLVL